MTKEEIDILWHKAMRLSIEDGDQFTRYRFAELVVAAERQVCMDAINALPYQRSTKYDCMDAIRARSNT